MKKRGLFKTALAALTIALSSITVFAIENQSIDYIEKMATINETHKAYEVEDTTSQPYVREGEEVEIVAKEDNYYKVKLEDGLMVYIEDTFLDVVKVKPVQEEIKEEKIEEIKGEEVKPEVKAKSKGEEIVDFAKQYVGTPYVSGGNSLTKGVDCSGFTSQVFKNFDINLQRSSGSQYASNGTKVSKSELKAGDLVFYGYNGKVSHVAIYMGNSQIVHASTSKYGVKVDPLELRGMPPIIGYKRVI